MGSNAVYWSQLLMVAGAHILAAASPGPDFAITMRTSLVYSRRSGLYCALGIALGIIVHVTYCLMGIGLVISRSILLFSVLKWIAAGYLIWIGSKAIRAKKQPLVIAADLAESTDLSVRRAIGLGFFTNALNPKATLFFLALFTTIIRPDTPIAFLLLYAVEMVVVTFAWFSLVAYGLSTSVVREHFLGIRHWIDRAMGAVLIALGIKVATATRN